VSEKGIVVRKEKERKSAKFKKRSKVYIENREEGKLRVGALR
jgi:hypothetical protein